MTPESLALISLYISVIGLVLFMVGLSTDIPQLVYPLFIGLFGVIVSALWRLTAGV